MRSSEMNYQIRQANPGDVLPALNLALRVFTEFNEMMKKWGR